MADLSWFLPTPVQEQFIRSIDKETMFAGGIGCIAADTLIFDPATGRSERVDEIRGPGYVWALNDLGDPVVAARTAPVCKGEATLYRFVTDDGEIVATGEHRFLTTEGWKRGEELEVGAQLLASVAPIPPHPTPLRQKDPVGQGEFYDFHVPVFENYWAAGMWHHNSGKTLSGAFKALTVSLNYPGTTGLVGRQTYRALEDTTKRVIVDGDDKPPVIPAELIADRDDRENRIVLRNGSEILFRSLEDYNVEKLRSLNLGWFYVDEATESTLKLWMELCGRLRHPVGPRIGWGTTNPNGHDWVWKRFHPDAGVHAGPLFHQPSGANPHLAPDYLEHLRASMPKEWIKRMVDGSFDTAAGMIWEMWDRNVHVVPTHTVRDLPVRWFRGRALDHGRRNPTAVLWSMVDNDGFIIMADEHYESGLLPSQHAPIIRAKDQMLAEGINLGSIIAPPDCFRLDANGHSVADEYMDAASLAMTAADDNVDAGLLRVGEWMKRDPELAFPEWHDWAGTLGPDELGSPRLFIADCCVNLIAEVPEYAWRDLSPTQESKQDQPEEPRKLNDHACFPAGTLVAAEFGDIPIEQIEVGSRVWTRKGLRGVEAAGLTQTRASLAKVTFSDGSSLIATPDHPLWVEDSGDFVCLDELRYSDECLRLLPESVCPTAKRDESGRRRTDRSRMDGTSTMSIATRTTTRSAISWPFRRLSICRFTAWTSRLREPLLSARLVKRLRNGIDRMLAAPGTLLSLAPTGRSGLFTVGGAISVASPIRLRFLTAHGSAQTTASQPIAAHSGRTMRYGLARCAASHSSAENTSSREPAHAHVRVCSVEMLGEASRSDVFSLTVADEHEFYANGVLVSNCDALRYWLMSRPRPFPSKVTPIDPDRVRHQQSVTHGLLSRNF